MEEGKSVTIDLWDTAGQERLRAITRLFYVNSKVVIFVYDVTDKKSFDVISNWMKNVIDIKGKDFPVMLVGNKIDLVDHREVSTEEGENSAKQYGIQFFEISNKFGTNVEEACSGLINLVVDTNSNIKDGKSKGSSLKVNKKNKNQEKNDCNC